MTRLKSRGFDVAMQEKDGREIGRPLGAFWTTGAQLHVPLPEE